MPYHEIPVETKVNAVMDHIRGLKPSEIERKHQVDRDSLRLWVRKAKVAIEAALTPNPGRPPANNAEKTSVPSQKSQKLDVAESAQAFPSSRTTLPKQCPLCGGSHLVRNGCYPTGGKRIPLERVQRFVCRDCGSNLYQPKKTPAEPAPLLCCLSGGENLQPATIIRILPCHDLVGSAMLCCFAEFLKRVGVPEIFGQTLTPVRKIVSYTATDYFLTLVLSVAVGCDFNVAIDYLLRPYPQVARLLGMPGFPEQSSVSGFLHAT